MLTRKQHNELKYVLGLNNPLSDSCRNQVDVALGENKSYNGVMSVSKNGYITTFNIGSCKLL